MKALGILLIVVGAVVGYFTVIDRETALALDFVEAVPHTSAWAVLVGLGLALVGIDIARGLLAKPEEGPKRHSGRRPKKEQPPERRELPLSRGRILAHARGFGFGNNVRLEPDTSPGVPLTVVLQHMSPQAVKRTCVRVAAFVSEIPRPPRVRIRFEQCPDDPSPRQHVVTGAISTHIARSEFKATSHLDHVEVLFFNPDPEWLEIWGS